MRTMLKDYAKLFKQKQIATLVCSAERVWKHSVTDSRSALAQLIMSEHLWLKGNTSWTAVTEHAG